MEQIHKQGMNSMKPKIKQLLREIKRLIHELEAETGAQPNQSDPHSSIDPFAFDVVDMGGYSGQEYGGFPEPIMKMEDEF